MTLPELYEVSIPNGKPGPLRLGTHAQSPDTKLFQSQTGSQALSDLESFCTQSRRAWGFQSQTGSQALSDFSLHSSRRKLVEVSIPNGKPGPLRPGDADRYNTNNTRFNPKREARPSQTRMRSEESRVG